MSNQRGPAVALLPLAIELIGPFPPILIQFHSGITESIRCSSVPGFICLLHKQAARHHHVHTHNHLLLPALGLLTCATLGPWNAQLNHNRPNLSPWRKPFLCKSTWQNVQVNQNQCHLPPERFSCPALWPHSTQQI